MQNTLFKLVPPSDIKTAERLRRCAEALAPQIEAKRNPAIASQRPTARRARIAASMREDADNLEKIQHALNALALGFENGTLPEILRGVRSRSVLEMLVVWRYWPSRPGETLDSFIRAGLDTEEKFMAAVEALQSMLPERPQEDETARRIKELETDLIGRKIPGYFPTPRPVVDEMLHFAEFWPGIRVLEPSAGNGNIADVIREMDGDLSVIEINYALREILALKGYKIVGANFLEHSDSYDLIVMNPPFEKGQDIDHVHHAYRLLRPGGRVVSIMCEGPFFRKDLKSEEFRSWLDERGYSSQLPDGSFEQSGTGVRARIVVLDKED